MKCKFCGEEMPENGKFCPFCGADNSQMPEEDQTPATVPEETAPEQACREEIEPAEPQVKKAKRVTIWSGCIAVMAVLALVLFLGVKGGFGGEGWNVKSLFDWEMFRDNDVFKKDSYSVSDDKAQKKADTIVATLGDATLTNSQLQIFYQMEVIDFINSYSYYLSYFGLDYTKPLDEQECMLQDGATWQQYFIERALETWQQYQALAMEAEENDYKLESELQEYLDGLDASMAQTATEQGFDSADAFLQSQCGANTDMSDYKHYMNVFYNGYLYFGEKIYNAVEKLDDAALDAYFQENKETLEGEGIKQDGSYTVDVRHILIKADGTENEDGTITFTDAEAAAEAKAKAEQVLALWLENPTEDNFAALAKEYTGDTNGEDGGLYEGVTEGYMVATFNDWCFDENRKVGDYGIVETKFGYHIMFFSARGEDTWKTNTQSYYISQQAQDRLTQILDSYTLDVDYSKIALAYVSLG